MERVTMPQLGETVTEGTITKWWKQVGEPVAVDDVLFEVSTDKVDTEVPSAHSGVLRAVYVAEGETVPIGTLLALITEAADSPLPDSPGPVAPSEELSSGLAGPAAGSAASAGAGVPMDAAPAVRPGVTPHTSVGATAAPVTVGGSDADGGSSPPAAPSRDGSYLSPVVFRLLTEQGLSASDVVGTGRDGRITRADVLAAAANRRAAPSPPPAPPAPATAPAPAPSRPGVVVASGVVPGADDLVVEFTRARRMTAEHMVRSLATSAHTLVVTEVDYTAVEPVRREAGLNYLPFVARAVIDALAAFPHLNASVGDDALIVHRKVHLGVAVDVGGEALVVPVVEDAGTKRLRALAEEVAALAQKARAKRLSADDLSGGTFSITNVGRYGTVTTFPVINQPQVGILSTDGVRMRPVAVPDGRGNWAVVVHPVGNLSLSFDHRAVDGAYASAFLARVRDILEQRDWSQEV
jgi:2-oxoglutarate dehydrogenase E2 component (dihydrolipoamide succinyltransferase)